jgi:hypothetical protein
MERDAFTKPRYIMTDSEAAQQAAELKVIDAERITNMQACEVFLSFHAMLPDKSRVTDDAAEAVAAFLDSVTDWSTAMGNAFGIGTTTHTERLEACRSIFEELQKVRAAGFDIVFGRYRSDDALDIVAVTFMPMADNSAASIRQLVVPKKVGDMLLSAIDKG